MRLLIDDTLVTAPFVAPLRAGWVTPAAGIAAEARPGLRAGAVGAADAALLPLPEATLLAGHALLPDVAVVADSVGAVGLRTPVRPDEVEATVVRLVGDAGIAGGLAGASGGAEALARATLHAFYGITVTDWLRDDGAPAQAVVVEGIEALRPAEGGHAEDLCRAWFILVGLPFVSHALVVPADAGRDALSRLVATLDTLRAAGEERRKEWRGELADREGIPRDRIVALFQTLRWELGPEERKGVNALLSRGLRGSAYPAANLRFLDPVRQDSTPF